jgi:hypothetical protein
MKCPCPKHQQLARDLEDLKRRAFDAVKSGCAVDIAEVLFRLIRWIERNEAES